MAKRYPDKLRSLAIAMVRAGRSAASVAADLGVSVNCIHNWVRQDQVSRGEAPRNRKPEGEELRRARQRIRELELQVELLRAAAHPAE